MNAEPGEAGILALLDASSWFGEPPLIDLWSNHTGGDSGDMSSGYTFPTCKPVKRIDYLFFRRRNTKISVKVLTSDVRIVGRDASTDTGMKVCLLYFSTTMS